MRISKNIVIVSLDENGFINSNVSNLLSFDWSMHEMKPNRLEGDLLVDIAPSYFDYYVIKYLFIFLAAFSKDIHRSKLHILRRSGQLV